MGEQYEEMVAYLLFWFERNARILAWREHPSPYYVWVSEIMLQQTRVEAVKGYFDRFIAELPDIRALALAPEERLLKLWEGLGYYNRVRNMQRAARIVVEQYGGELPADYEQLRQLPGIGAYTAGAIASIAFGLREPCVDGNVLRVCMRVTGSYEDITKEAVKKELTRRLRRVLPADRPGMFNQALMELGALICLPNGKPHCEECPVMHLCQAFHKDIVMELPVKPEKKARRIEERTVFLIRVPTGQEEGLVLHRRPGRGLLAGLWELPGVEGYLEQEPAAQQLMSEYAPKQPITLRRLPDGRHIFTHVEWRMRCYEVRLLPERLPADCTVFSKAELEQEISVPSAFECFKKYFK